MNINSDVPVIHLNKSVLGNQAQLYQFLEKLYLDAQPNYCLVFPESHASEINAAFDRIILHYGFQMNKSFDFQFL
jgi:hypothetical protein